MTKKLTALCLTIACLFACAFSACSSNTADSLSLSYFNTHIYVQTIDKQIPKSTEDKLIELFSSLENEFNISNKDSFVYKFNNALVGSSFVLSELGASLFNVSRNCVLFTNGLFNPTVYPLIELWQFAPNFPVQDFSVPTNEQILALLPLVDIASVNFDSQTRTITKTKAGVKLDFGGILKGFAVDLAGEILINDGIDNGYISIGGSSIYILKSEKLDVRHPRQTAENPLILSVDTSNMKNFSVSSSGDYEKFYSLNENTYSHLINPLTGTPSDTFVQSVSILGVGGTYADAFSTAGCLCSHLPNDIESSQLVEFFKKVLSIYPSAQIYAVYNDGQYKQVITNQDNTSFTLLDKTFSVVKF